MSGSWTTEAWFTNEALLTTESIQRLLHAFIDLGCRYHNPYFEKPTGFSMSRDGMESFETDNIEAVSSWLVEKGGGGVQLWYGNDEDNLIDFSIGFDTHPIGIYQTKPLYKASLIIDSVFFREDNPGFVKVVCSLTFKWSHLLVQHLTPLFAVGDLDYYDMYPPLDRGLDLSNPQILKIGWWNYYDNSWVKAVGEHNLYNHAVWATHKEGNAKVIIMAPPGLPTRCNKTDATQVFVE